jgi:hypothetical protein
MRRVASFEQNTQGSSVRVRYKNLRFWRVIVNLYLVHDDWVYLNIYWGFWNSSKESINKCTSFIIKPRTHIKVLVMLCWACIAFMWMKHPLSHPLFSGTMRGVQQGAYWDTHVCKGVLAALSLWSISMH